MSPTSTTAGRLATWGDELVTEPVRGVPMRVYRERPRSLVDLLEETGRWDGRAYLVDEQRELTFGGFRDAVDRVATVLAKEGVQAGDRVMLLSRNSIEWIVAFWAVARLGALVVLGNAWWSEVEVKAACETIAPRLLVADRPRAERVPDAHRVLEMEALESLVAGSGEQAPPPVPPPDEDAPAVIVFTSGTTGAPKGAVLSHRSVIANQQGFLARTHRLPSDQTPDRPVVTSLLSTPLFHTGGIQAFMTALLTGGRLVFLAGRFEPARVLDLIERERITVWAGVPTMLQRVLDDDGIAARDLSSVRAIGVGGAPLPAALIERAAIAFPNARRGVSTNYGSTEAGGIVSTASGADVLDHPGSSGRPLPAVEVRIDSAAPDTPGEVLVRSAAVFSGYWGDPAPAVDEQGWLHTGDVGTVDRDGFLHIVDRLKDIVIRGGENIASAHVELALQEHPQVTGAAVLGLPHPDLGEEVAAVIVARDAPTEADLQRHAAERLAHFEIPTRWWIRSEELPLNATGKVDKRALRAAWPQAHQSVEDGAALQTAAADPATAAVVIRGAGDGFCAGQDLRELAGIDPEALADHPFHTFIERLAFHPKPVLAAVEGAAVGAGLTILLHCDFVIAATGARFRAPFVALGSTAEAASSVLAPAVLGPREAARLLMLCEWYSAEEAHAAGLVTEVVADGASTARARELALHLAEMPRESVLSAKRLLVEGRRDAVAAALARERDVLLELYRGERIRASAERFVEAGGKAS